MESEVIHFFSRGVQLTGVLTTPTGTSPHPALVQGPGWLGLSSSASARRFAEAFAHAGIAYLVFDYRGFGESDGERGWINPFEQVEDILCALTYARTRADLDPMRLGLFGFGGTGGGNAIVAGAIDRDIRCVISQTPVADGELWLRQMRRAHEWIAFRERLTTNQRRRVLSGEDEMVDPREEIMVATPERAKSAARRRDDESTSYGFHLSSAEWLLRYRPIDYVDKVAPAALLLTCVDNDAVTPAVHAVTLYERAKGPKRLIRQLGVSHYEAYDTNYEYLLEEFIAWCNTYLIPSKPNILAVEEAP